MTTPTGHDDTQVLLDRARRLAIPLAPPDRGDRRATLVVRCGAERWGLDAEWVLHVMAAPRIIPIPGAPPTLLGLAAWRGGLLTILDLRQVLGLLPLAASTPDWLVVVGDDRTRLGVLVEAIDTVASLDWAALQPSTDGTAETASLRGGLTSDATLMLDLAALVQRHRADAFGAGDE